MKTIYRIQDSEAGNVIDTFATLKEAETTVADYEKTDKADGVYTQGFYTIISVEME